MHRSHVCPFHLPLKARGCVVGYCVFDNISLVGLTWKTPVAAYVRLVSQFNKGNHIVLALIRHTLK